MQTYTEQNAERTLGEHTSQIQQELRLTVLISVNENQTSNQNSPYNNQKLNAVQQREQIENCSEISQNQNLQNN